MLRQPDPASAPEDAHRPFVDPLLHQLPLAGLHLGEIQDVVDNAKQMRTALPNGLRIGRVLVRPKRPEHLTTHDVGEPDDGRKRRAQIVAHHRQEL
jgi:hypothetical protein